MNQHITAEQQSSSSKDEKNNALAVTVRVSTVSIVGNLLLTVFKLFAGIFAHSGAMVSDAVHSASDVISSFIVIVGAKIAGRQADQNHPYGHERFESVAAMILAAILVVVGGTIGLRAAESIINGSYKEMVIPGVLALIASAVSIVAKAAMFFYTKKYAKAIHSTSLSAEAWHHLSDALSSIGAMIGIGGAMLGVTILEPIASIVICLLILKAALEIFRDAVDQMVDRSCDKETEEQLRRCIAEQEGVLGVDMLHTRMFGNKIYVDVEIAVDPECTVREGHAIAERVHDALETGFRDIKHVMVHVNPADES